MSSVPSKLNGVLSLPTIVGAVGIAAVIGLWLNRRQNKGKIVYPSYVSLERQSIEVPDEPGVYGSPLMPDGTFCERFDASINTVYDAFLVGSDLSHNGPCLGWRPSKTADYKWKTYNDVMNDALKVGSALIHLGLKHGNSTFVGIYGRNCVEWFTSAFGCVTQSMVIVPLYDTLGADAASFIINQTNMELIVCDTQAKVDGLLSRRTDIPTLRTVAVIDFTTVTSECKEKAELLNVRLLSYADLLSMGSDHVSPTHKPTPEHLYIICYTSGTTGMPKGVMLSHRNIIANITTSVRLFEVLCPELTIKPGDSLISYLPLSHMFEQLTHWYFLSNGGKIGYFQNDIKGLTDDIKALKPTCFPVVPRLLNRLYDTVNGGLKRSNIVTRALFKMAYQAKLADLKAGIIRNDTIWDKLVFSKIHAGFGGQLRQVVTGSAPLSHEVLEFTRVVLGCIVVEGYGQTECTAVATMTLPTETIGGHVGGPVMCAHIKLVDVAELDYYSKDGKGEICIKGPCVMSGYYKDEVKTKEAIDEDGWLHTGMQLSINIVLMTGDVGMWLPNGALKIIDRKKHIFKLQQGEYVAPEKIENVYDRSNFVAQIYVDGDSLQRFLVAIVVPDEVHLTRWYKTEHGHTHPLKTLCNMSEVREKIMSDLMAIGKEAKLNSIEQVKAIHLITEPFTAENGLLTPTLKNKRPQLRKHYNNEIQEMYRTTKSD